MRLLGLNPVRGRNLDAGNPHRWRVLAVHKLQLAHCVGGHVRHDHDDDFAEYHRQRYQPDVCDAVVVALGHRRVCVGMMFMATDPVTAAHTNAGRWWYGSSLIGVMVILIHAW